MAGGLVTIATVLQVAFACPGPGASTEMSRIQHQAERLGQHPVLDVVRDAEEHGCAFLGPPSKRVRVTESVGPKCGMAPIPGEFHACAARIEDDDGTYLGWVDWENLKWVHKD